MKFYDDRISRYLGVSNIFRHDFETMKNKEIALKYKEVALTTVGNSF